MTPRARRQYTVDQVCRFCLDWSQGKWTVEKETRARNAWAAYVG